jgi:ComF family protein
MNTHARRAEIATKVVDAFLSVLLAPVCAACEKPLDEPTRGPVCGSCWQSIRPFTPPLCDVCGDPLPSWRTISIDCSTCARCRRGPHNLTRSLAIGDYDGPLRAVVHALKYDRRRSLARPLAALLARDGASVLSGADIAVPVPLHRSRKRARGFNQAAEIARYLPIPSMYMLKRVRPTVSQTDLPAAKRHANVRNAFALRRRHDVTGLVVVLVDDVSTTGATLESCARVLKAAGAREIRALTIARVVSRLR